MWVFFLCVRLSVCFPTNVEVRQLKLVAISTKRLVNGQLENSLNDFTVEMCALKIVSVVNAHLS